MDYNLLESLLSRPRLERYLQAAHGDREKAVELYFAASLLAGYYACLISLFEVVMRNKISSFLADKFSGRTKEWLIWLGRTGSPFDTDGTRDGFLAIASVILRLANANILDNDRAIASLPFGFWTALFKDKHYRALGNDLLTIFPCKRNRTTHAHVRWLLDNIRNFRNRIAHNEPIIFKVKTAEVDFTYLELKEGDIVELTDWLGVDRSIYAEYLERIAQQKTRTLDIISGLRG
jgi:hypothetical protein